jgi:hypothetical protein
MHHFQLHSFLLGALLSGAVTMSILRKQSKYNSWRQWWYHEGMGLWFFVAVMLFALIAQ